MKTKLFGVVFMTAMIVTISWHLNQNKNKVEFSNLVLANVEALANSENTSKKGLPTSKEITKYFYDTNGKLIKTEKYTAPCCAPGSSDCTNPPCSSESL